MQENSHLRLSTNEMDVLPDLNLPFGPLGGFEGEIGLGRGGKPNDNGTNSSKIVPRLSLQLEAGNSVIASSEINGQACNTSSPNNYVPVYNVCGNNNPWIANDSVILIQDGCVPAAASPWDFNTQPSAFDYSQWPSGNSTTYPRAVLGGEPLIAPDGFMNDGPSTATLSFPGNTINPPASGYECGTVSGHHGFGNQPVGVAAQIFGSSASDPGFDSNFGMPQTTFFPVTDMNNLYTGSNMDTPIAGFESSGVIADFSMGMYTQMPRATFNSTNDFTPGSNGGMSQLVTGFSPADEYMANINSIQAPSSSLIRPAQTTPAPPPVHRGSQAQRVHCTTPGCNKSFKRPSDLARHASVHRGANGTHLCPVFGCSKSHGTGYSRADKVTEHLWKKHANLGYTKA